MLIQEYFSREVFDNAINKGQYINAVEESLKAETDADADTEKLRERLFFGTERVFENALKEASNAKNSAWLNKILKNIPDYWIASDDNYDLDENNYNIKYRKNFIQTQLVSAIDICNGGKSNTKIPFPPGLLQDFVHIFQNQELSPIQGNNRVKIPVLLLNEHQKGFVAFLYLEQVDSLKNSSPYPHPILMSDIPIDDDFKKTVDKAFQTVRSLLKDKDSPVWRWWVESNSKPLSIKGPSLYGAFIVGMYGSALDYTFPKNLTTTCSGDDFGQLDKIDGLVQKYHAAIGKNIQIVVSGKQDYNSISNYITKSDKKGLLIADTAKELIEHFFGTLSQPENIEMKPDEIKTPSLDAQTIGQTASTFLDITDDWKSFIYKLVVVVAAGLGIAGLGILLALYIYPGIVDAIVKASEKLSSEQITFLMISIIVAVFFIVVLTIYTRVTQPSYPGGATPPFKNVFSFIILILIILSFIGVVIYLFRPPPPVFGPEQITPPPPSCLDFDWCSEAKEALTKHQKRENALEYVNKGLEETNKNTIEHNMLLAFKIKLLLLMGDTPKAKNEADQIYGSSSILDQWIGCLRDEEFFSSLYATEKELKKCPLHWLR